jgi:hypothetical protein
MRSAIWILALAAPLAAATMLATLRSTSVRGSGFRQNAPIEPDIVPPLEPSEQATRGVPPASTPAHVLSRAAPPAQPTTSPTAFSVPPADAASRPKAFADAFDHQGIDPRWARDTTVAISNGLRSMDVPGTSIRSIECRQTLCRITATFSGQIEREQFIRKAFVSGSQSGLYAVNLPFYAPGHLNGDTPSEIYLMRE